MRVNLKTTLSAYSKVSPTILNDYAKKEELNNYVTKSDLDAKDYVSHEELDNILENFIMDVDRESIEKDPSLVYGRASVAGIMKWVPMAELPGTFAGVLCYGMTSNPDMTTEEVLDTSLLHRERIIEEASEYLIEYQPKANGYFWFCYTDGEIDSIEVNNGISYVQNTYKQPETVSAVIDGQTFNFYCARTSKLVAYEGIPYKFKITIK